MKNLNEFTKAKETDTSQPHPTKEGTGKDDAAYFKLMDKYKQERRKGDGKDARKYLDQANSLCKTGDVSSNAKLGAAYL